MINKLKPKSEFNRNVLTLMTGTTIAQAIPIAITPVLTRIYTPEDFGVLALFIAITSIFGSIANGRYDLAIMLPDKDEDAINILALGIVIVSAFSLLLLAFVIVFNEYYTKLLDNKEISIWLYFVPATVFFIGIYNLLEYFNIRKKNFNSIAKATIARSTAAAFVQLSVGLLKGGVAGLISGQVISQITGNLKLYKNIRNDRKLLSKISKVKMRAVARRYVDFPKFTLWAGFANTSSSKLTNILISSLYSISTLGFYSMVQRVLGLPSTLIGTSIGQVFFKEAMAQKQKTGCSMNVFNRTSIKLIIIAVPVYTALYFVVEDLFALVFGEEWRVAGVYANALVPLFCVQFIVSPLTPINQVYLKNKNVMFWQIGLLVLSLGIILTSHQSGASFLDYLRVVSVLVSAYYVLHYFLLRHYIKNGSTTESIG
jgi:O-antigen/teichoic acid export membrane protein